MERLSKAEFSDVVMITMDFLKRMEIRKFNKLFMVRHVFLINDKNNNLMEIKIEVIKTNVKEN